MDEAQKLDPRNSLRKAQKLALEKSVDDDNGKKPRGILSICPRAGKTKVICEHVKDWSTKTDHRLTIVLTPRLKLIRQFFQQEWCKDRTNQDLENNKDHTNQDPENNQIYSFFMGTLTEKECSNSGSTGPTRIPSSEFVDFIDNKIKEKSLLVTSFDSCRLVVQDLDKLAKTTNIQFLVDEAHMLVDTHDLSCDYKSNRRIIDKINGVLDSFEFDSAGSQFEHRVRYFTGTPIECVDQNQKNMLSGEELKYVMNNTDTFGETLYTYTYEDAVLDKAICPMQFIDCTVVNTKINEAAHQLQLQNEKNHWFPILRIIHETFFNLRAHHLLVYVNTSQEAYDLQKSIQWQFGAGRGVGREIWSAAVYTGCPRDPDFLPA